MIKSAAKVSLLPRGNNSHAHYPNMLENFGEGKDLKRLQFCCTGTKITICWVGEGGTRIQLIGFRQDLSWGRKAK